MRISLFLLLLSLLAACAGTAEQRRVLGLKREIARDGLSQIQSAQDLAFRLKRNAALIEAQQNLYFGGPDPGGYEWSSIIRATPVPFTNSQEQGGDEGGILKLSGSHLVVLRDGNLFVLSLTGDSGDELRVVDRLTLAEVAGEQVIWFDKLFTDGAHLFVHGFDYENLRNDLRTFRLASNGKIEIGQRYAIRSLDDEGYEGYARFSNNQLTLQFSLPLSGTGQPQWPEWARIDQSEPKWQTLVSLSQLYFPSFIIDEPVIHSFLSCNLAALIEIGFQCETTAIVGNRKMQQYQTRDSHYIALGHLDSAFVGDPRYNAQGYPHNESVKRHPPQTTVLRLPRNSSAIASVRVRGSVDGPLNFHQRGNQLYMASVSNSQSDVYLSEIDNDKFDQSSPLIEPIAQLSDVDRPIRFGHNALWVGGRYSRSAPILHVQPLDGSAASILPASLQIGVLAPVGMQMIALGEGRNFATRQTSSILDLYAAPPHPRHLQRHSVSRTKLAARHDYWTSFGGLADHSTLFAWPLSIPDQERESNPPVSLHFAHIQGEQLTPIAPVSMADGPPAKPTEDNDWYGNARVAFLAERILILSGDLVKEVRFNGSRMDEVRRAILDRAAHD